MFSFCTPVFVSSDWLSYVWPDFMKKANIVTYTKICLIWFSQLLQENNDTALQNILSQDENLQMLEEIGFRGNPHEITQSMKSTVLR